MTNETRERDEANLRAAAHKANVESLSASLRREIEEHRETHRLLNGAQSELARVRKERDDGWNLVDDVEALLQSAGFSIDDGLKETVATMLKHLLPVLRAAQRWAHDPRHSQHRQDLHDAVEAVGQLVALPAPAGEPVQSEGSEKPPGNGGTDPAS